jgi:hypothetical protein
VGSSHTTSEQSKCHNVCRFLLQSSIPFSSLAKQRSKKILKRAPLTPASAQDVIQYRNSFEKKRYEDEPIGQGEIEKARAQNPYGCG